jgi:hypothetical protein
MQVKIRGKIDKPTIFNNQNKINLMKKNKLIRNEGQNENLKKN